MPSFKINEKDLWIGVLQKAGVPIETHPDGTRWVEVGALFDYLQKARGVLGRGRLDGPEDGKKY